MAARLAQFDRLRSIRLRLTAAVDVGALFATAAACARQDLGYRRAIVLGVDRGRLTASTTDALDDAASDALRSTILSRPLRVTPGTAEAVGLQCGVPHDGVASPLADELELEHHAYVAVAARGIPLALLVVDRSTPDIDRVDHAVLAAYGAILSGALETHLVTARLDEVAAELRSLTFSTHALLGEVRSAPPSLPVRHRDRLAFANFGGMATGEASAIAKLTPRERAVAALLAEGLSNREIAARLVVSPETAKAHVAHIIRKLGAVNRVDAVARYLQAGGSHGGAADDEEFPGGRPNTPRPGNGRGRVARG